MTRKDAGCAGWDTHWTIPLARGRNIAGCNRASAKWPASGILPAAQRTAAEMTPGPSLPESVRERAAGFVGRRWVLDEVRSWLEDRSERYFMILGEPGSGKTAVAAWLAGAVASA